MGNIALLTNTSGIFIGEKNRYDVITGETIAITGLLLTNSKSELLIAQRSLQKKHDPGLWGPAAAGTLEPGENFVKNIVKEAEEEIGLSGIIPEEIHREHYWRPDGIGCYAVWFRATTDLRPEEFVLQKEEVVAVRWVQPNELLKELTEAPEHFTGTLERWKFLIEMSI